MSASTTGRSSSVTSQRPSPCRTERRGKRCDGCTTEHGLRTEPSGAIATAALLSGRVSLDGEGDLVVILSGRNVDEDQFRAWITPA